MTLPTHALTHTVSSILSRHKGGEGILSLTTIHGLYLQMNFFETVEAMMMHLDCVIKTEPRCLVFMAFHKSFLKTISFKMDNEYIRFGQVSEQHSGYICKDIVTT